jgi:formate hydrogenlyase subunit 3/multisubunit Na+/H+ antiporter MnhD subunit
VLSAGLRLVLAVAAPLLGAALVHELRAHRRTSLALAVATIIACAALTLTVAPSVSGGASLERDLGTAIPGVDITARADSASVALILIACLAALLTVPRRRDDGERLAGMLLCLAGAAFVVAAGNLVLVAGGVELVAGGTLLLRGRRGPGARSAAVLATVLAGAGLALVAAAAQLVAQAGSSDLAFVPQGAIDGAVAVPWALGGAALLISPAIPGEGAWPGCDWAAIAALPAGFLVLLRLLEAAGGQLPGNAAVVLAIGGAAVACAAAFAGRRAITLAAAGRSAVGVLAGLLVSLFGGALDADGTVLAGLFLAIEVALLAAPSWDRSPTGWAGASIALLALPGGAGFAVLATGLGTVAHRGPGAFPQLLVLTAVLAAAAVAVARALAVPPRRWRPLLPGAGIAVVAGLAGGLLPGLALRTVAAPLAGGAVAADLDPGALALPGGDFAGGYFATAAAVLVVAAVAALVLVGDEPIATAGAQARPGWLPPLSPLLRLRRRTTPALRAAGSGMLTLDHWLESQPGVPLFLAAVVAALVLFR